MSRLILHIKQFRLTFEDSESREEVGLANFLLPLRISRLSKTYTEYMHDLSVYHSRLAAFITIQSNNRDDSLQRAEIELKMAIQAVPDCSENLCALGRLYSKKMEIVRAIECFEMAMQMESWPVKNHRLFEMQLARCYYEVEDVGYLSLVKYRLHFPQFEKSKLHYLQCCRDYSTPGSWKGVGMACYKVNLCIF